MCITDTRTKRNSQLEWHKIHWEPVKESPGLDIPTRYRTINLIRLRNLLDWAPFKERMVFRGYNKVDSHEEEKEDNYYCPLCKLRKEEDFNTPVWRV